MRGVLWALAICIWLASATLSWQLMSTLFMFGALDNPMLLTRLVLWAPIIALAGLAIGVAVRRRAVWLPAILLLSPALQLAGLLLAKLDPVT